MSDRSKVTLQAAGAKVSTYLKMKKTVTSTYFCQAGGKASQGRQNETIIKKLWVKLVKLDMKKTELAKKAGISSASVTKLGKGVNITTYVLVKICECFKCDIADIAEIVPDESSEEEN